MTASRQDAWTEDDDLLLAEVTLRHIREGSTQLAAFEEVGFRLGRTAAACGFRWNSYVRKKYESAIQIAKAQRQQLKSKGQSRFQAPDADRIKEYETSQHSSSAPSLQAEVSSELGGDALAYQRTRPNEKLATDSMSFDDVIRFLKQQKESYKKLRNADQELKQRDEEIARLREENERMRKELNSVQNNYETMNEDYKALVKIMDRARKMAFLGDDEDQEEKISFKMDRNGNLERVDKS